MWNSFLFTKRGTALKKLKLLIIKRMLLLKYIISKSVQPSTFFCFVFLKIKFHPVRMVGLTPYLCVFINGCVPSQVLFSLRVFLVTMTSECLSNWVFYPFTTFLLFHSPYPLFSPPLFLSFLLSFSFLFISFLFISFCSVSSLFAIHFSLSKCDG